MSFNETISSIINSTNANIDTLQGLLSQLQHTTITSSDDTLYQAPTLNEITGLWTLAQTTPNVNGEYVGCYKLPVATINAVIQNVTVINHTNPASPNAPASVTPSGGSTVDLAAVTNLQGQSFNSFCIRSATPFTITLRVSTDEILCNLDTWHWDSEFFGGDTYASFVRDYNAKTITADSYDGGAWHYWKIQTEDCCLVGLELEWHFTRACFLHTM